MVPMLILAYVVAVESASILPVDQSFTSVNVKDKGYSYSIQESHGIGPLKLVQDEEKKSNEDQLKVIDLKFNEEPKGKVSIIALPQEEHHFKLLGLGEPKSVKDQNIVTLPPQDQLKLVGLLHQEPTLVGFQRTPNQVIAFKHAPSGGFFHPFGIYLVPDLAGLV